MKEILSTKNINRIKNCLQMSPLSVFDYDEKINSQIFLDFVISNCSRNLTPVDIKLFNIFTCSSCDKLSSLFNSINKMGLKTVINLCEKTVDNPSYMGKVILRTIFGATEELSFKSLSYILPAISLGEELEKFINENKILGWKTPKLEFWFMNEAGISINSIDKVKTSDSTNRFINLARSYISNFHSSMQNNVFFYTDEQCTNKILNSDEFNKMFNYLKVNLELDPLLKSKIFKMGSNKTDSTDNILKYTVLHYFTQDGFVNNSFYIVNPNYSSEEIIISLGASPEIAFFMARDIMIKSNFDFYFFKPALTVQYISKFNVPPYYIMDNGDFGVMDVLNNTEIFKLASKPKSNYNDISPYSVPVQKACNMLLQDMDNDIDIAIDWLDKFKKQN